MFKVGDIIVWQHEREIDRLRAVCLVIEEGITHNVVLVLRVDALDPRWFKCSQVISDPYGWTSIKDISFV